MKKNQLRIIEVIGALGGLAILYLGTYRGPFETAPTLSERIALTVPMQILKIMSVIFERGSEVMYRDSLAQNTPLILVLAFVQVVVLGFLFGRLTGILAKKISRYTEE